jgi:dephospho-CoA kinase
VDKAGMKPIIGILGGIGSGKSTVAAEFVKLGCGLIDADKIAHELLEEKSVKEKIINHFGEVILDSCEKISHKELADIVFNDSQKLSILNGIIHPLVFKKTEELIAKFNQQSQIKAIVLDMPLLLEVGWEKRCDRLIFVDCDEKIRAERAKKMNFKKNQLKIRENFQISLDKKASIADNTVVTNSGFCTLVKQVADIFSYIMDNSRRG